jgi:hypothetical protein
MRHLLGADLACIGLADLMVVTGVSRVKDHEELCLAWEFGLGGTRWHGIGIAWNGGGWHWLSSKVVIIVKIVVTLTPSASFGILQICVVLVALFRNAGLPLHALHSFRNHSNPSWPLSFLPENLSPEVHSLKHSNSQDRCLLTVLLLQ